MCEDLAPVYIGDASSLTRAEMVGLATNNDVIEKECVNASK